MMAARLTVTDDELIDAIEVAIDKQADRRYGGGGWVTDDFIARVLIDRDPTITDGQKEGRGYAASHQLAIRLKPRLKKLVDSGQILRGGGRAQTPFITVGGDLRTHIHGPQVVYATPARLVEYTKAREVLLARSASAQEEWDALVAEALARDIAIDGKPGGNTVTMGKADLQRFIDLVDMERNFPVLESLGIVRPAQEGTSNE